MRQRLQALIADGAKVTEAEARQAWEVERSRVRAAYLLVPPASGEGFQATDAELEAYCKAHPAEFTEPERRRVLVAVLPAASVPGPGRERRRHRGRVPGAAQASSSSRRAPRSPTC